ncbi:MAG: hypothetical protein F6K31_02575 [Symploca sp. SIO2G7]|nr:hypothetical protein [Symploca sp. SIO2G7]
MGFLRDKLVTKIGTHTIEVRGDNHVLRGLIYKLLIDGEEVASEQNFWKLPTKRRLEAQIDINGTQKNIVVLVKQQILSADFSMMLDSEPIQLKRVE